MLCLIVLDLNSIKELFNRLIHPGDKYLVVEILNHYIQVTALQANFENKQVYIFKNLELPFKDLNIPSILKATGTLLKKIRKPAKYNIILSLDPRLATTIYSSVPLIRQRPNEVIDDADIDNLISQAIWRFFDRQRVKVAQKMDVDDIDVLLSDVRIRNIKIDGHKILNPVGFKAKSVEIYFSQTFVVRDFFRGLKDILPVDQVTLVAETGAVLAHNLFNVLKQDKTFLVNLFPDKTVLYAAAAGKLSYLDQYQWGENNLLQTLGEQLSVDPEVSKQIIGLHNAGRASPILLKRLETILTRELQLFANGLESAIDHSSAQVHLNPYFNLPTLAISQRFQGRLNKSFKLLDLSTDSGMENFGFAVKLRKSVKVKNSLTVLAALAEVNSLPQNDKLSRLAQRRVRWLS